MVGERPAEARDRAVPWWKEPPAPSYFLNLPADPGALSVKRVMREASATLPAELKRSTTQDHGTQMASHPSFATITNGLARQ